MTSDAARQTDTPALRRTLGLALLVLYGVGITVGAGIYVLIGAVTRQAGPYAPWSFLLAAAVMAGTVAAYAELSLRFPVSAGEAAYVRAAFGSRVLSTATGLLTLIVALISSAAVAIGAAGYIRQFIDLPPAAAIALVVLLLAAVAAWGILESVMLASLFTLIEVAGLLAVLAAAAVSDVPVRMPLPPLEATTLAGIAAGSVLAFFAFVGFQGLVNVIEEAKRPDRDIPRAIGLTLMLTTLLYVAIAAVAVSAVPTAELAASPAPLSLVFKKLAGIEPRAISAIAIFATLNTILAQMTMATRLVYGMAKLGDLPSSLAAVDQRTGTPLAATLAITALVLALALLVPFERLAVGTSVATLVIFALVNLSLLVVRRRRTPDSAPPRLVVPLWVPAAGLAGSLALIAASLVERL